MSTPQPEPTPDQLSHMRKLAVARAAAFCCPNYTEDLTQEGWIAYYSREGTEAQRFMNAWDAMLNAAWKWKYGIHYSPSRTNHPNVTATQVVFDFDIPYDTTPEDIYARKEIIEKTHQALQQDHRKMSKGGVNWSDFGILSKAGVNWDDLNVLSKAGVNWDDLHILSKAGVNWEDIGSLSKSGVNWDDLNALTKSGVNWNDIQVLTKAGVNWEDIGSLARANINWNDLQVLTKAGVNWDDMNTLTKAGVNWDDLLIS